MMLLVLRRGIAAACFRENVNAGAGEVLERESAGGGSGAGQNEIPVAGGWTTIVPQAPSLALSTSRLVVDIRVVCDRDRVLRWAVPAVGSTDAGS